MRVRHFSSHTHYVLKLVRAAYSVGTVPVMEFTCMAKSSNLCNNPYSVGKEPCNRIHLKSNSSNSDRAAISVGRVPSIRASLICNRTKLLTKPSSVGSIPVNREAPNTRVCNVSPNNPISLGIVPMTCVSKVFKYYKWVLYVLVGSNATR
jgi:hypothetical protein